MVARINLPDLVGVMPLSHGFEDDFDVQPAMGSLQINIERFQEADGTALADFADGASTTPGYAHESEVGGIRWNNHANPDPIAGTFLLPRDIDTNYPATLHVTAAKVGATLADAVTWAIGLFNNASAATYDADADYGGASSAMTGDAATKTVQVETRAVAAADLGAAGEPVYMTIQPTDGTLGTDDVILIAAELEYVKKSQRWVQIGDTAGSATVSDAAGGRLSIATGGTDNDEYYVFNETETFIVAADKPVIVEARIQFTEANTDDANIIFGLVDAVAADALQDNAGGPPATYDGAVFFKLDGETRWRVESSNAGTQVTTETEETAGGASFQTLRIEINPKTSSDAEVIFSIDSAGGNKLVQVREQSAHPLTPDIKHDLTVTGLEEMHVVLGAKAGGGNAETLVVDYVVARQKR